MNAADTVVTLLTSGLLLGEAQESGPLTLVPLFHEGEAVAYRLFAGALAEGVVTVEELEGGSVPELVVVNHGLEAVLLLEGEVVGGLRQTRTLNTTVLVPARETLVIPVSCVEEHRWGGTAPAAREEVHASPGVRSAKNVGVREQVRRGAGYESDMGEVWASVDRHLEAHGVHSPSGSYAEVQHQRRGHLDGVLAALRPVPGQRGVLAVAGGRPLALDVFDRPDTLASLWSGLVGSYAADAVVARPARHRGGAAARGAAWVAALAGGEASTHRGVGEGEVVFLATPAAVVSALIVGAALVHLAAVWAPGAPEEALGLAGADEARIGAAAGSRPSWFGERR
ncbi:MAG: hypothetical protein MUE66_00430 [Acidimicrobiia bacterium]|jgi:hypothetical protein|nr:hypothetical protein [Acidimicrobiia bacterium]